jgi:hypothetical protein
MNTKTTAVEWLFEKLWNEPKDKLTWNAIFKVAKQMEKEHIFEFWKGGQYSMEEGGKSFEQYYKETYDK